MKQMNYLGEVIQRTPKSVTNVQWHDAEHTMLDCLVVFKELEPMGPIPFSTLEKADTPWGQWIWDQAMQGSFGKIAEHRDYKEWIANANR